MRSTTGGGPRGGAGSLKQFLITVAGVVVGGVSWRFSISSQAARAENDAAARSAGRSIRDPFRCRARGDARLWRNMGLIDHEQDGGHGQVMDQPDHSSTPCPTSGLAIFTAFSTASANPWMVVRLSSPRPPTISTQPRPVLGQQRLHLPCGDNALGLRPDIDKDLVLLDPVSGLVLRALSVAPATFVFESTVTAGSSAGAMLSFSTPRPTRTVAIAGSPPPSPQSPTGMPARLAATTLADAEAQGSYDFNVGSLPDGKGGTVRLKGQDITGMAPRRIWRLGVGRTFQITATFASIKESSRRQKP